MLSDQKINELVTAHGGGFRADEFLSGREKLSPYTVDQIIQFRNWHNISMQITSAWRPPGGHSTGQAIDFLLWQEWRKRQPDIRYMWRVVTTWPWMGIGIYFDWNDGIGFHVDTIAPPVRDRPLRWIRTDGKYYYQRISDGLFYHNSGESTSLENEITKYLKA